MILARLGDDARSQGIGNTERAADGKHPGALARIPVVRQRQEWRAVVIQLEQGQVLVLADLDQARFQLFAILEYDGELARKVTHAAIESELGFALAILSLELAILRHVSLVTLLVFQVTLDPFMVFGSDISLPVPDLQFQLLFLGNLKHLKTLQF